MACLRLGPERRVQTVQAALTRPRGRVAGLAKVVRRDTARPVGRQGGTVVPVPGPEGTEEQTDGPAKKVTSGVRPTASAVGLATVMVLRRDADAPAP